MTPLPPAFATHTAVPRNLGRWLLFVLALAVALGPTMASVSPAVVLVILALVGLAAVGYVHPPAAAYILLAGTPLLAGFARNAVIPVLRPHEALGVLLGLGVSSRVAVHRIRKIPLAMDWSRLDGAILLMALTSSVLPLLWMAARGLAPSRDDLLYAATLWKFYGLYLLIRTSIRTERQVARALSMCLAAGAVVAVVAILQSVFSGVADLLYAFYPEEAGSGPAYGRGSSTLGSSIAVGDVMAFDLAIALRWALSTSKHRKLLLLSALLFAFGAVGTGQFSAVIGLVVAVVAVAVLTGHVRRMLLAFVPTLAGAGVALWPVIAARLADVDPALGIPLSWWVRLQNLELYIWPQLFSGWNWLFGVEPAAVLTVDAPWATEIYIESGHTWLLWTGGLPFACAYLYFTWTSLHLAARVHRARNAVFAVAAAGSLVSLLVVFVLMTFDPHITMRGTADLLFSLAALTAAGSRALHEGEGTEAPVVADDAVAHGRVRSSLPGREGVSARGGRRT